MYTVSYINEKKKVSCSHPQLYVIIIIIIIEFTINLYISYFVFEQTGHLKFDI